LAAKMSKLAMQLFVLLPLAGVVCPRNLAGEKAPQVELKCRLLQGADGPEQQFWAVQLRNSAGETLRQASAGAGSTIRFEKLKPAIYVVCVTGSNERSRCESVDLYPPADRLAYSITRDFELPKSVLHSAERHKISRVRLAIPKRARQEMARYEECRARDDHAGALQHLERALAVYPGYPDALNNLGAQHHRTGNYERSIRLFRKATEVDPDFATAWLNLGGSLLADGRFRQALEAQRRALALRSDDAVANAQAGMSHYYLREYSEARTYFERVVELDPESATFPHLYLAHIATAQKHSQDAARYMHGFLRYHPNSPQAPSLRKAIERLPSSAAAVPSAGVAGQP